jgi:hypothetical protein
MDLDLDKPRAGMIRLLHCNKWKLKEVYRGSPEYAILSHTWEHDRRGRPQEVEYGDLKRQVTSSHKRYDDRSQRTSTISFFERPAVATPAQDAPSKESGWQKIEQARVAARNLGQKWIWIDSCCINKDDVREHTEAINSMYQWYADAQVCITYLGDVESLDDVKSASEAECRWFSRGWTLQELVAPSRLRFYNKNWLYLGSRNGVESERAGAENDDLSYRISEITGINQSLLRMHDSTQIKRELASIPASQKMFWASARKTTKPEDTAYSLIGIFDLGHMHLKPGEGASAFIRLQEEIIRQTSDPTLFAWTATEPCNFSPDSCLALAGIQESTNPFKYNDTLHGIFACHPIEFKGAGRIRPSQHLMYSENIALTSRGVKFNAPLWGESPDSVFIMAIDCYTEHQSGTRDYWGIQLRWVGSNVYARTNISRLEPISTRSALPSEDEVFLLRKLYQVPSCLRALHRNAIRLPTQLDDSGFSLEIVSPRTLCLRSGDSHQLFMTTGCRLPLGCARYEHKDYPSRPVLLVFGLDYSQRPWSCLVEPGSDLAPDPSSIESRRTYLSRIWGEAFRRRTRSVSFPLDDGIWCFVDGGLNGAPSMYAAQPTFDVKFDVSFADERDSLARFSSIENLDGTSAYLGGTLSAGYEPNARPWRNSLVHERPRSTPPDLSYHHGRFPYTDTLVGRHVPRNEMNLRPDTTVTVQERYDRTAQRPEDRSPRYVSTITETTTVTYRPSHSSSRLRDRVETSERRNQYLQLAGVTIMGPSPQS